MQQLEEIWSNKEVPRGHVQKVLQNKQLRASFSHAYTSIDMFQ